MWGSASGERSLGSDKHMALLEKLALVNEESFYLGFSLDWKFSLLLLLWLRSFRGEAGIWGRALPTLFRRRQVLPKGLPS